MTALFLKVLDMSAKASIVILIVLVLRLCLKRAPKVYSYVLWSAVLLRLLCPFSIESGISVLPADVGYTPPAQTVEIHEVVEQGREEDVLPPVTVAQPAVTAPVEQGSDPGDSVDGAGALVFVWLWPTGVALMGVYSLWSLFCLRRRLRCAIRLCGDIWQTKGIHTAFVLGVFHPKIYLPAGLSEEETPYIICHEEYHIRRGDHIVKLLAFAALCIHWFNPLVWLAFVLMNRDMEMSCDEAVLKEMDGDIRANYSQSLLSLAAGRRFVAAAPLAFGEGDTKSRIKNVLKWKKPGMKVMVLAAVVCAAAVAVCISDPVRPVDTTKVERVYTQVLSLPEGSHIINEDEASVTEKLILGEAREELFALLNSHTAKRTTRPDWKPTATYGENAAWLEMNDGSRYELRYWYTNGFSFHPAHFGEDEYDSVLAHYDSKGNLISCWKMEYDFDRVFRDWLWEQGKSGPGPAVDRTEADGTEVEYAPNKRVWSFEDLKPGQTFYFPENIVLSGEESTITSQITYSEAGLTLEFGLIREDGRVFANAAEDGNLISTYQNFSGGVYTVFIRNVNVGDDSENKASGSVVIELSAEKDYFQKSTPFLRATVFDKAKRVMVNGNVDVPEASKAELIRLLNAEEEKWQDTPAPVDFALQIEQGSTVRLLCEDGSWYLLECWRDESGDNADRTTLTWKNRDFQIIGTWIMDDDFNESYRAWLEG